MPTRHDLVPHDPIATDILLAYLNRESGYVAKRVFPIVETAKDSGKYASYDAGDWMRDEMKLRAPGTVFERSDWKVTWTSYLTEQFALERPIPDETAALQPDPINLTRDTAEWLGQKLLIRWEVQFAADYMIYSNWANSDNNTGAGFGIDWDDYTNGDPIGSVRYARRKVLHAGGGPADTLVMGLVVHDALMNHPDILDRIKYNAAALESNVEAALPLVFGVRKYLVGEAVYDVAGEGQSSSLSAMIDDDCLICYAPDGPTMLTQCAGKIFVYNPGGGAGAIERWRDDRVKSDVLRIMAHFDMKLVSSVSGFFYADIV